VSTPKRRATDRPDLKALVLDPTWVRPAKGGPSGLGGLLQRALCFRTVESISAMEIEGGPIRNGHDLSGRDAAINLR